MTHDAFAAHHLAYSHAAPTQPMATAGAIPPPVQAERVDLLTRLFWAVAWRGVLVGGIVGTLAGDPPFPRADAWLAATAWIALGLAAGLYRRRGPAARLWRLAAATTLWLGLAGLPVPHLTAVTTTALLVACVLP